ncbi:bacteriocin [Pseudoalteromonas piscicida]|uniref:bacteriocin n=1 Tax=Pseudoalteromonas piscicida TaxID=43662 RepID=UPI001C98C10B|nr:bacteriocin [Pseudoalteromonas piscicida]QZO12625.1 bacteriocin [Pseudoalteromonas piscicida]
MIKLTKKALSKIIGGTGGGGDGIEPPKAELSEQQVKAVVGGNGGGGDGIEPPLADSVAKTSASYQQANTKK